MKREAKYAAVAGIVFLCTMPDVTAQERNTNPGTTGPAKQSVIPRANENPAIQGANATTANPNLLKNQIPVATATEAQSISNTTGVPLSVTLSDLITKSAPVNFSSTLQNYPFPQPPVTTTPTTLRTEDLLPSSGLNTINPQVQLARAKGYQVRNIDFDSRYVANLTKLLLATQTADLRSQTSTVASVIKRSGGISEPQVSAVAADLATVGVPPSTVAAALAGEGVPPSSVASALAEVSAYPASYAGLVRTFPQTLTARIWQGVQIDSNNDPYSDSVAVTGNNALCSGTLITPDIVVTAGHCYCDGVDANVIFGTTLLAGTGQRIIPVDLRGSESLTPCDKLTKDISAGDVAVLKLQQSVTVAPRAIASLPDLDAAAAVRAVGFGRTSTGGVGVKYQVDIIVASAQCDGIGPMGIPDTQIYQCKKTYELVAAGLNRDTCNGDSGGPIYIFGRDAKLYLAGTTSRSVNPNGTCGPGGIYEVLSDPAIRPWLEKKGATFEPNPHS